MNVLVIAGHHLFSTILVSTALQVAGTFLLTMFSFKGLKVSENENAYMAGTIKVEVVPLWLNCARIGFVLLILGIGLGGVAALASLSPSQ